MMKIEDFITETGGELISGNPAGKIGSVSIDSRTIRRGEAFVAIEGERFDGHRFVADALAGGAAGAIVSRRIKPGRRGIPSPFIIRVPDTVAALGHIAGRKRRDSSAKLVAVTGSNGKTTTKDMIASVCASKYPVLKNEGNLNNHIGVPLTLLRLRKSHKIAVVEMGMNHRGELAYLGRMARPDVVVITGVGHAHLGYLLTPAAIARAKCELLEEMKPGGAAVINADHPLLMKEAGKHGDIRLITFGVKAAADYTADRVARCRQGLTCRINGKWTFTMRLLGAHNVYNALAAWSAASYLGFSPENIRKSLESFRPPAMRMELRKFGGMTVINDAYNANPESFDCAIETITSLDGAGRKILVAGDMLELGEKSEELHRRLGGRAARAGIDMLIAAGEYARATGEGAANGGMKNRQIFAFRGREDAERLILREARRGDIILIKGSRKTGMEKIVEGLKRRKKNA